MRGRSLWHRIVGAPARLWHELGRIAEMLSGAGITGEKPWRDPAAFHKRSASRDAAPDDDGSSPQSRT